MPSSCGRRSQRRTHGSATTRRPCCRGRTIRCRATSPPSTACRSATGSARPGWTSRRPAWLRSLWETSASAYLDEVGLAAALRWFALAGFSYELMIDCVSRYKIARGTRALVEAIAGDGGAEIRLESPVAAVEQDGGRVAVRLRDGSTLEARGGHRRAAAERARSVAFDPPLSHGQAGGRGGRPGVARRRRSGCAPAGRSPTPRSAGRGRRSTTCSRSTASAATRCWSGSGRTAGCSTRVTRTRCWRPRGGSTRTRSWSPRTVTTGWRTSSRRARGRCTGRAS